MSYARSEHPGTHVGSFYNIGTKLGLAVNQMSKGFYYSVQKIFFLPLVCVNKYQVPPPVSPLILFFPTIFP